MIFIKFRKNDWTRIFLYALIPVFKTAWSRVYLYAICDHLHSSMPDTASIGAKIHEYDWSIFLFKKFREFYWLWSSGLCHGHSEIVVVCVYLRLWCFCPVFVAVFCYTLTLCIINRWCDLFSSYFALFYVFFQPITIANFFADIFYPKLLVLFFGFAIISHCFLRTFAFA